MDTDELSNETYSAVLTAAEMFNHDLTLHFGCLASQCKSEEDYLFKADNLIKTYLEEENMEALMDDLFFGNPPKEDDFRKALLDIQLNINKVRQIPIEKRIFEF